MNPLSPCVVVAFVWAFLVTGVGTTAVSTENSVTLLSRTGKMRTYPCSSCHRSYQIAEFKPKLDANAKHAELHYKHMEEVMQCTLCHHPRQPDSLVLMDGTTTSMDQMNQVCGQCHGKIEYDWSLGLHGKQTGSWIGPKTRWTCGECHDPHAPKFKTMEALNPPPIPNQVIRRSAHQ